MTKLSTTSALVLLWARRDCYRTETARAFLNQLDLSEGTALYETCNEGFPYSEVIRNRKFGVMHFLRDRIARDGEELQIVIPGAGLDPLGLELVALHPRTRVYEIDRDSMEAKSAMVARMMDRPAARPSFISADLMSAAAVREALSANGWRCDKPSLLVLEGISYYLPSGALRDLVGALRPDSVILEYLKRDEEIASDRLGIPQRVFGRIAQLCELSHISRYDRASIEHLFDGMPLERAYGMMDLERMRTGANTHFPTEVSGWIEVCLLRKARQGKRTPDR